MSELKVYNIAEIFTSPQGEGLYTGAVMTFIRLAGCTVGKHFPKERYEKIPHCEFKCVGGDPDMGHGKDCTFVKSSNVLLPIYTEMCTTYDGRNFECDTDYRMKKKMTVKDILLEVPEKVNRICLTGGEPLMHDVEDLVEAAAKAGKTVHIETSGTIEFGYIKRRYDCYVAVSPKFKFKDVCIRDANEIKILVDRFFEPKRLPMLMQTHPLVYIQPINGENTLDRSNMDRCLELQKKYPNWRISSQAHKLWGVR